MRVNGFQCDTCCKTCNRDVLKGWFVNYFYKTNNDTDEQHFCSIHCLGEWVKKQMSVVGEVEAPFEIDVPRVEIEVNCEAVNEYWRDL